MTARNYYDGISKGYNSLYGKEQLHKWKSAKKLIKFSKKDIVLDLGCGTGLISKEIISESRMVVGIDISKKMIQRAGKIQGIFYLCADASNIPFKNKSFDKVVSFTMLQDISDWKPVLKEINRVSKKTILLTLLKRNKKLPDIKKTLGVFFKIKKVVEEEKDFIFLLEKK